MNLKAIELYYLIKLLDNYEIGIVNKIKFYSYTYNFNNDRELRIAVKLWKSDKSKCINKYCLRKNFQYNINIKKIF